MSSGHISESNCHKYEVSLKSRSHIVFWVSMRSLFAFALAERAFCVRMIIYHRAETTSLD